MNKYPCSQVVKAIYSDNVRAIYRDNPLIEALPDCPAEEEMREALALPIPYEASERNLPAYERRSCISSLSHLFVPMGYHGEIVEKVFAAIREGYVSRNPLADGWNRGLAEIQSCVKNKDSEFRHYTNSNANASGFMIVGESGMGKTSAVNRALNLLPQIICHSQYHGTPFPYVQIVWMKLECPQDASVKGLCSEFFQVFDGLTEDNTFAKYAVGGRATVDQMIPQMALVARRHGLGLLVIDEIQNLSAAKSGGMQKMLNFFVQLTNKIGLPILLVGTPPAIQLLSTDLMTSRRSSGQQGLTYLKALDKNSQDWEIFFRGIWRYQWTSEKTKRTQEMQNKLCELSRGNVDMALKLFMEAQRLAIDFGRNGGSETLTPELLDKVAAQDTFKVVLNRLALERGESIRLVTKQTKRSTDSAKASMIKGAVKNLSTEKTVATTKTNFLKGKALISQMTVNGQMVSPTDEF